MKSKTPERGGIQLAFKIPNGQRLNNEFSESTPLIVSLLWCYIPVGCNDQTILFLSISSLNYHYNCRSYMVLSLLILMWSHPLDYSHPIHEMKSP